MENVSVVYSRIHSENEGLVDENPRTRRMSPSSKTWTVITKGLKIIRIHTEESTTYSTVKDLDDGMDKGRIMVCLSGIPKRPEESRYPLICVKSVPFLIYFLYRNFSSKNRSTLHPLPCDTTDLVPDGSKNLKSRSMVSQTGWTNRIGRYLLNHLPFAFAASLQSRGRWG